MSNTLDTTIHRYYGIHFNQKVWEQLSKPSLTVEEGYALIDIAHASNHHWRFAGTEIHQQRGAYVIARVFMSLGNPEAALIYAQRCMSLTKEGMEGIMDFDFAYANEIMWKCLEGAGKTEEAKQFKKEARRLGDLIESAEDKEIFEEDYDMEYRNLMKVEA